MKNILVFLLFCALCTNSIFGQDSSTSCQTVTDALIGPDRNDFVHNEAAFPINEGYLHNFTPPSFLCDPDVTSLLITIDIMSITTIPDCDGTSIFGNILRNCALTTTSICGITEDVLTTGCNAFGGGQTTPGVYSLDLANCEVVNNSDVIGVDIIPYPGDACASTSAITDGDIALTYQICIQYTYDQDFTPCENTIIMPCDDDDICTVDDMIIVDFCDNSIICTPCTGVVSTSNCNTTFLIESASADISSNVCLNVNVTDFTNITSFQYSINWDSSVLDFTDVTNINLIGLSETSFSTGNVENGSLTISWPAPDISSGETVPTGTVIFQVCFDVLESQETNTVVSFSGSPTAQEVTAAPNGQTIVDAIYTNSIITITGQICNLNLGNDTLVCDQILLDTGDDFIDFIWSDGSDNQTLSVTTSGTYSVTATNADGCTNMDVIEVTVVSSPQPLITGNTSLCDGTATELSLTETYTSYLWSNNATTPTTSVSAGTHSVTVTDANGCMASSSIEVTNTSAPTVEISGDTDFCVGASTTLSATTGYASYLWSNNANTESITILSAGNYQLTVTNDEGCQTVTYIDIIENPLPTVTITGDTEVCTNETVTLAANSVLQDYLWSTGATTPEIQVSAGGIYTLSVTDTNGCQATAQTEITNFSEFLVSANAGEDIQVCEPNIQLAANLPPGTTGVWTGPDDIDIEDPTDPNSFIYGLFWGEYNFNWTLSTTSCPNYSQSEVNIDYYHTIVTTGVINRSVEGIYGEELTGNVLLDYGFFGETDNFVLIRSDTLPPGLTLIEDNNGSWTGEWTFLAESISSDEVKIGYGVYYGFCLDAFHAFDLTISTPFEGNIETKGITPNGDGVNDYFCPIENILEFPDNKILIFNRWGDIVFEQKGYQNDWGGTNQKTGAPLPAGTYYYMAWLDVGEGEIRDGSIIIIR